jgi:hypothetical protein
MCKLIELNTEKEEPIEHMEELHLIRLFLAMFRCGLLMNKKV